MKSFSSIQKQPQPTLKLKRSLSVDDILLKSNSSIELEKLEEPQRGLQTTTNNKNKICLGVASAFFGLGVGMAMMPIFNEEVEHLENYGIDVHENSALFTVSTLNTLFLMSSYAAFSMYHLFNNSHKQHIELNPLQQKLIFGCKILAATSSIASVAMLWDIELENQKIAESEGFDQYVAWAAFSSLPLIAFKSLSNYEHSSEYVKLKLLSAPAPLDSLGAKLAVYGIDGMALIARFITYTNLTNDLLTNIGLNKEVSLATSVIASGIMGNVIVGVNEHAKLKKLFLPNHNDIGCKEISIGILSAIEGSWFALPAITAGLEATTEWNGLIRGVLFLPMFLAHANYEAKGIYDSLIPSFTHQEQEDMHLSLIGDFSNDSLNSGEDYV